MDELFARFSHNRNSIPPEMRRSFMQQGSIVDIPAIWAENLKEKQMEMNWQRRECHLSNSPSLPPEGTKKD